MVRARDQLIVASAAAEKDQAVRTTRASPVPAFEEHKLGFQMSPMS